MQKQFRNQKCREDIYSFMLCWQHNLTKKRMSFLHVNTILILCIVGYQMSLLVLILDRISIHSWNFKQWRPTLDVCLHVSLIGLLSL